MLKKTILGTAICLGLACSVQQGFAQDETQKDKKEKKKEEKALERPSPSGLSKVDGYASKAFDSYDESKKISEAIEFIKVETKQIPDKGDGVTTEMKISNGKGEAVTKENALKQFGELLLRAMKQNENIKALAEMKKGASEEIKTASMMAKPKAGKALAKGGEAEVYTAGETKTQIDLINQQVSTIKAIKSN